MNGGVGVVLLIVTALLFAHPCSGAVTALFTFGDSLVDPGNNDVTDTIAKANFAPYGVDFYNQLPTGRFTNGLLTVDILATLLNLPYPAPYAFANNNVLQGVNFGSASTGVLPLTGQPHTFSLTQQVDAFTNVRSTIVNRLGINQANSTISRALFYICTTNNDINNFYVRNRGVPDSFQTTVVNFYAYNLQRLYNLGARKFVVVGLSSVGCIPLHQNHGVCDSTAIDISSAFNRKLYAMVADFRNSWKDAHILWADYEGLMNQVHSDPKYFGFSNATAPCCQISNGPFPIGGVLCRQTGGYCSDRSKYMFWDNVHPTEAFNKYTAQAWYTGPTGQINPINIQALTKL